MKKIVDQPDVSVGQDYQWRQSNFIFLSIVKIKIKPSVNFF